MYNKNGGLRFLFNIRIAENDYSSLNSSQIKVFNAIKNDSSITTKELVKVVGLQTSRISTLLKELKELGKIERVGSNKNGYWKV